MIGEWSNRLVRATAQRAMSSLLYKDKMRGKVQLVYMDPPYNISFSSQFAATADKYKQVAMVVTSRRTPCEYEHFVIAI